MTSLGERVISATRFGTRASRERSLTYYDFWDFGLHAYYDVEIQQCNDDMTTKFYQCWTSPLVGAFDLESLF